MPTLQPFPFGAFVVEAGPTTPLSVGAGCTERTDAGLSDFGVSSVAQAAAVASLEAEDELLERVESLVAERTRVVEGVRAAGWDVPEAQGNFLWFALGDRTLAALNIPAIGIAYAGQETDSIPHQAHDRTLDMVLTEQGIRRFR